jgi:cytidine deaminase
MDAALRDRLRSNLERCIGKVSDSFRTSSVARSVSGAIYDGVLIGSDTNLLTITSEQVALSMATAVQEYGIEKVITMTTGSASDLQSPLVLKILVDHALRTKRVIAYSIVNQNGETLFEIDDVQKAFPFYSPVPIILEKVSTAVVAANIVETDVENIEALKQCAIEGILRNFPLYDSASGYGAAVMTSSGKIFFSGQYSSPDRRLSAHAEMNAMLCAVMAGETDIIRLGVVSSKFTDEPCQMCGMCRQFLAEMCAKWNIDPAIHCFASETDASVMWRLKEYLPATWTSKKW